MWNSNSLEDTPRLRRATRFGLTWPWALAATLTLLAGLALVACGDDDASADSSDATTVSAVEGDGTITLDRASSPAGDVEFAIKNEGELAHQFIVLKTDLAHDKLPLDGDTVDESASEVEVVGEKLDIGPGSETTLAFESLAAGSYVLICNVPAHYGLGMHAAFTVE